MKRTPLYECHREAGARFVDFGGWEMPVQYAGIQQEHDAVRRDVGLFDVSHMGEVEVRGPGALDAVNALITNDLNAIADGQACYTAMCKHDGGIVDDLVVYRFSPEHIFICVNASNREKDFSWICAHIEGVTPVDRSDEFGQLALQGPRAAALLSALTTTDLSKIGRYWFAEGEVAGVPCIISRTGYTGEDGFELYLPAARAAEVWRALMSLPQPPTPAGLGARDTLRLEMKYALYGNDIDETTTPLEAGLGWITKLKKERFIGKEALVAQRDAGVPRALVAFKMEGRMIPRHGYPVLDESGAEVGVVTSGTKSPTSGECVGMAYVPARLKEIGARFSVQIRKSVEPAVVVKAPFVTPGS